MLIKDLIKELRTKQHDTPVVVCDPDASDQVTREIENIAYVQELNQYVIWLKSEPV